MTIDLFFVAETWISAYEDEAMCVELTQSRQEW